MIMANNRNTNEMHTEAVDDVLKQLPADSNWYPIKGKKGAGFDIKITSQDQQQTIYLCVVKMRKSEGTKSSPYCAVSATKWDFAIRNSTCYYFVIALQKEDNSYLHTFYSVEEFWHMTSKPKFNLYCHRNKAKVHRSLLELTTTHPMQQDQTELNNIHKSINKLIEFKNSL